MFRRILILFAFLTPSLLPAQNPKPKLRFVSEKRHQELMKFLPKTDSKWFEELKKKDLIFYDEKSMPKAYQIWDSMSAGVHSPDYNISASKPKEPFGNANVEFPWGRPAGLENSPNSHSIRFVFLPLAPIIWWRERLPGDDGNAYLWKFAEGTVFGEILTVPRNDKRYDLTFEVRTRTRKNNRWEPNVFRPFLNHKEMASKVRELDKDGKAKDLINALEKPLVKKQRLKNDHSTIVIDRTALVHDLPPADPELIQELLLETPFRSALGEVWVKLEGQGEGYAPSNSRADFHVVPRNYNGTFLSVGQTACMNCHDSVLKHANDFQRFLPSGELRDWYGRVRGGGKLDKGGGIFSFHIFDPSSISYNGAGKPVILRRELIESGLLKKYGE